jgi:hypothetical protein
MGALNIPWGASVLSREFPVNAHWTILYFIISKHCTCDDFLIDTNGNSLRLIFALCIYKIQFVERVFQQIQIPANSCTIIFKCHVHSDNGVMCVDRLNEITKQEKS